MLTTRNTSQDYTVQSIKKIKFALIINLFTEWTKTRVNFIKWRKFRKLLKFHNLAERSFFFYKMTEHFYIQF